MRDPNRIDKFCDKLKEIWKTVPDWRFGQLMCNAIREVTTKTGRDVFFVEDEDMIDALSRLFDSEPQFIEQNVDATPDEVEFDGGDTR